MNFSKFYNGIRVCLFSTTDLYVQYSRVPQITPVTKYFISIKDFCIILDDFTQLKAKISVLNSLKWYRLNYDPWYVTYIKSTFKAQWAILGYNSVVTQGTSVL